LLWPIEAPLKTPWQPVIPAIRLTDRTDYTPSRV
jgi:hypothetical protein